MSDKKEKVFSRAEWNKTPYAKSKSDRFLTQIVSLLEKYECENMEYKRGKKAGGRKAVMLRFQQGNKPYRIVIETLNAPAIDEKSLFRQTERAIYATIKSALEMATVFTSIEKALFIFMELGDGGTIFEIDNQQIEKIARLPERFGLALPSAPQDIIDAEIED